jgi:3-hydroxyanthranilate 3,4-dioxygenase
MPLPPPLDLPRWLRENSDRLRPPVNNFCLYSGADFIVMVIGGPNARADYHVNETEVQYLYMTNDLFISTTSSFSLWTGMVLSTQGRDAPSCRRR